MHAPTGAAIEVLYIDDHFAIDILPKSQLRSRSGRDFEITQSSHLAYAAAGLARAPEKGFGFSSPDSLKASTDFTVIGTQVQSEPGLVGAPEEKRAQLFALSIVALKQAYIEKSVLRRHLSLYTHPFMHRRELMCLFHRSFKWCSQLQISRAAVLPADICDELASAALMLPHAVGHIRWPVSARLSCTDATPQTGGAVAAVVSQRLADSLYRMTEFRGSHVRLDTPHQPQSTLLPPDPLAAEIVKCIDWRVTRSHSFSETSHINLQEMHELRLELQDSANRSLTPLRLVNGTDSMVCLGAWARGRSSSYLLNGILRRTLGWQIMGRKSLSNFHLRSEDNPSDDPSRLVELRAPSTAPAWMSPLLEPSQSSGSTSSAARGLRLGDKICRECYAGCGGLSRALRQAGLRVGVPMEAFPCKGKYVAAHDLHRPEVIEQLERDILDGIIVFLHFGVPCKTWGAAGLLNRGTRRKHVPQGLGSLLREIEANREVDAVVRLCFLLVQKGGHFTIENPANSFVWLYKSVAELMSRVRCFMSTFDQCQYGLKFEGTGAFDYCRKRTSVLASFSTIRMLDCKCPGVSQRHRHVHAWGSIRIHGKSFNKAALAGRYPDKLCSVWAAAVKAGIESPPVLLGPKPRERSTQ